MQRIAILGEIDQRLAIAGALVCIRCYRRCACWVAYFVGGAHPTKLSHDSWTQIVPGGIHGIAQTQQKLLLLQGSRAGLPISPKTVMRKALGIENVEEEYNEWKEWKRDELEFAAKLKEEGASLMPQQGGAAPSGSQKGTGGRPPSGHKPPTAKTKASAEGPRATVTES